MKNYIFFIGGTGARVFQALIHICASGVLRTDEDISVAMLDVDGVNAACTDALELFHRYREARETLHEPDLLDAAGRGASAFAAFHPNLELIEDNIISPMQAQNNASTLSQVTGHNRGVQAALNWFYSREECEQNLQNGFYGRPNIGSVFFQSDSVRAALRNCTNRIAEDLARNENVRVAIVGSVFGGTGAAGIPSVQKIVRIACENSDQARNNLRNLHFAGVLVAPYFQVPPYQDHTNLIIDSGAFYGNTRSALKYYDFRYSGDFRRFYLVGQNQLEYTSARYADGGREQQNKAHAVELMAALGVKDFLTAEPSDEDKATIKQSILDVSKNNQEAVFGWNTLDEDLSALADMLRTLYLLRTAIHPFEHRRSPWYKAFIGQPGNEATLQNWIPYTDSFLKWIYHLQYRYNASVEALVINHKISLAGTAIASVASNTPSNGAPLQHQFTASACENFPELITNRTGARNVTYRHQTVSDVLNQLGNMGAVIQRAGGGWFGRRTRTLTDFYATGLFMTLYDIAARKA